MLLLASVVVLLFASMVYAGLLVRAAHGRAAAIRQRAAEHLDSFQPEESLAIEPASPEAACTGGAENEPVAGARGDAYADPIDGIPFALGEPVVSCQCGVGYRVESLEWLYDNLGGRCVECGYVLESRTAKVTEPSPSAWACPSGSSSSSA